MMLKSLFMKVLYSLTLIEDFGPIFYWALGKKEQIWLSIPKCYGRQKEVSSIVQDFRQYII